MRYVSLTHAERKISKWRKKRNALVCQLLAKDPMLLSHEALKLANKQMGPMPDAKRKKIHPLKKNTETKTVFVKCNRSGHLEERHLLKDQLSLGIICSICSSLTMVITEEVFKELTKQQARRKQFNA